MTVHIEGTPEQFKALMKMEIEGPIHMLNLLRYTKDGGRESYAKYSEHMRPLLEKSGGKPIFRASGQATVVGGEEWDDMFIVEYPSKDAFVKMILSDEYQAGAHLRHGALEDSRLNCMQATEIPIMGEA